MKISNHDLWWLSCALSCCMFCGTSIPLLYARLYRPTYGSHMIFYLMKYLHRYSLIAHFLGLVLGGWLYILKSHPCSVWVLVQAGNWAQINEWRRRRREKWKWGKINKFNIFFCVRLLFYLADCDLINNSFIKPSSSSSSFRTIHLPSHSHTHKQNSCDISCLHEFFSPLHVLDIFSCISSFPLSPIIIIY